ncbi:hypothetical protein [Pseudoalteromonas sp. OOF1S-7]|uniref:hypothetical protein n=1 Tax=Pseudoalteromonas sp. OOF1S-7 TaxID=2917757 RepID=UPI001EF58856|nr:hypothetical protein [Pseudoalteromonas sp. OOF1S-7]MCG7536696.1 hypothetical protein [Pseudoalteromonas sp. OOF1S-7]
MIAVCDIAWVTNSYIGTDSPPFNKSIKRDWFDPREYLGKKGHRYYSMATKYVLSAQSLLNIKNGQQPFYALGTSTADDDVRCLISKELEEGSETSLGATYAPNSSVNMPASCLSIKSQSNNSNFTFTGINSGFMSLWAGMSDVGANGAHYIVGQVESDSKSCNEGVILWDLNNEYKKPRFIIEKFDFVNFGLLNFELVKDACFISLVGDLAGLNLVCNDFYDVSGSAVLADFDAFYILSSKLSNGMDGDFYIVLNDNLILHLKVKKET